MAFRPILKGLQIQGIQLHIASGDRAWIWRLIGRWLCRWRFANLLSCGCDCLREIAEKTCCSEGCGIGRMRENAFGWFRHHLENVDDF